MSTNLISSTTALGAPLGSMTIDPSWQSRQELARKACESAGIEWPGTILPPGTALYDIGRQKLRADRLRWKGLPLASEVVGLVEEALAAEARKDFELNIDNLRFRETDGRLVRKENLGNPTMLGLGYSDHTLRQLVDKIDTLDDAPRGFSSALVYLSDQERAEILNRRMDKIENADLLTLRTKLPHVGDGSRVARAALSQVYGSVTDGDIARALSYTLRDDRAGRMDYKPGDSRSRFEIIWPSEIPVETFVVGDIHYACLSITNSETGQGSIRIAPAVIRAACANLTISTGEGTEVTIRHVGSPEALMSRLLTAIRLAVADLEPLLETITRSSRIVVPMPEPGKVFAQIAQRYQLPAAASATWLDTWQQKYQVQVPVQSAWSVTAAISDAAKQSGEWTEGAEWERVASTVQAKMVEVVKGGSRHEEALKKALSVN